MPKDTPILASNDAGNFGEKSVFKTDTGETIEVYIPHALALVPQNEWEGFAYSAKFGVFTIAPNSAYVMIPKKTKDGNKVSFDWNSAACYIVGAAAMVDNRKISVKGSEKYEYQYLIAYVIASFLQVFPDGHDNIYLSIGYPASEVANAPLLVQLLVGLHKCRLPNGKEISFNIRAVVPFDESRGGAVWMTNRVDKNGNRVSQYNPAGLNPGDQFLVFDVGGRIGGIVVATLDKDRSPLIVSNTHQPVNMGMIDANTSLSRNLKSLFPEKFKSSKPISAEHLLEAFQTGYITLYANNTIEHLDVREAVARSMDVVMAFQNTYRTYFDGSVYPAIILTGGAVRDLQTALENYIQHPNMIPVDTLDKIMFANANGGMLILAMSLRSQNLLPQGFEKVFQFIESEPQKKPFFSRLKGGK